jgi:hypothetical protein
MCNTTIPSLIGQSVRCEFTPIDHSDHTAVRKLEQDGDLTDGIAPTYTDCALRRGLQVLHTAFPWLS